MEPTGQTRQSKNQRKTRPLLQVGYIHASRRVSNNAIFHGDKPPCKLQSLTTRVARRENASTRLTDPAPSKPETRPLLNRGGACSMIITRQIYPYGTMHPCPVESNRTVESLLVPGAEAAYTYTYRRVHTDQMPCPVCGTIRANPLPPSFFLGFLLPP
jgi:hypothetical protein